MLSPLCLAFSGSFLWLPVQVPSSLVCLIQRKRDEDGERMDGEEGTDSTWHRFWGVGELGLFCGLGKSLGLVFQSQSASENSSSVAFTKPWL